jgi:hypothetical protein
MEPVRVKLYGLMPVTKRGYLFQLTLAACLLGGLLYVWTYLPPRPADQKGVLPPRSVWIWAVLDKLPWLVAAVAALYGIEAVIVFRRFARKEAAQRAGQSDSPQQS